MPAMPAFERMSVEQYRREVGLPPVGQTGGAVAATPSRAAPGSSKPRVRGGKLELLASGLPSEDQIQLECAKWIFELETIYPVLRWMMHVPNGGKRSRGVAGRMHAMGVRKGVVDFICPFPSPNGEFAGLAIELKSHNGTLSDEQKSFLKTAAAAGWHTGVARSLEQFIPLVERWLGLC